MSPARRRSLAAVGTAVAVSVAIAASGGGTTYAAFSDADSLVDNHVVAARVSLGLPGGNAPELSYAGLLPGVPKSDTVPISYRGNIPGDLALELRPQDGSAYCVQAVDGSWSAREGGALQLSLGSGWLDYCSLFEPGASVPVAVDVAPGTDLDVEVAVQLAPGTDHRFSQLSDVDVLTVTARQAGVGAFTDWAVGTISIGTGLIAPEVPAECGDLGQYKEVVHGTDGDDDIHAGNGKAIVLGLGGDDIIHGGNGKDCLVGGEGDDTLFGGNAPDIMIGGTGFDTCHGGRAPNTPWDCEAPVASTGVTSLSPPEGALSPEEGVEEPAGAAAGGGSP